MVCPVVLPSFPERLKTKCTSSSETQVPGTGAQIISILQEESSRDVNRLFHLHSGELVLLYVPYSKYNSN